MNEELNKKLAEWRFGKDGVEYGRKVFSHDLVIYRRTIWSEEDEEWGIEVLEDLTQSLDACFKWLVPKLPSNYDVLLSHAPDLSDWHCDILGKAVYIGEETTPALALCKAIEKLIDDDKSK